MITKFICIQLHCSPVTGYLSWWITFDLLCLDESKQNFQRAKQKLLTSQNQLWQMSDLILLPYFSNLHIHVYMYIELHVALTCLS